MCILTIKNTRDMQHTHKIHGSTKPNQSNKVYTLTMNINERSPGRKPTSLEEKGDLVDTDAQAALS